MPTVAYHVTSTRNRESIRRHGLDWTRMLDQPGIAGSPVAEGACVFLSRDLDEADFFVTISRSHHESVDIWEATLPEDIDLWGDAPPAPPYGEMDGFLYRTQPIPPDRVRLAKRCA